MSNSSESDTSVSNEKTYCIFLHLVEGTGLNRREGIGDFFDRHKDKIILNASLNGVKFEVEGHSTETATIFNSNCIWECELGDIKRMKTDNRPVKLECFTKNGRAENSPRRAIGSLLLPIRGVQTLSALRDPQFKLHWHKLGGLSSEWRVNRPEIFLLLIIVKKQLIESGQLEALLTKKKCPANDVLPPCISETSMMLQSQCNVYVQLLQQLGVIQVGNNPDVDCDIFNVTLTFKQLKHVEKLLELERHHNHNRQTDMLVFHYDFLGSVSQLEVYVNATDCYAINEKVSLSFKSSLKSLRLYFQRIFYIPINLYFNGIAIANYRFDICKLLPDDFFFNMPKLYTKNGSFYFDRLHKILSPRSAKPSVDFIFSMQLVNSYSKRNNVDVIALNETFLPYKNDEKMSGDVQECHRHMDFPQMVHFHKRLTYENCLLQSNMNQTSGIYEKSASLFINNGHTLEEKVDLYLKSAEEFDKETTTEREEAFKDVLSQRMPQQTNNQCVGTSDEGQLKPYMALKMQHKSIGTGTDTDNKENDVNVINTTASIAVNTEPRVEAVVSAASVATYIIPNVTSEEKIDDKQQSAELEEQQQPIKEQSSDTEELTYKIVQELEEWKSQQMEYFLSELERKEAAYLADLDKQWEQQRAALQARLDAKIAHCEVLNAELEKAQAELHVHAQQNRQNVNIADAVKCEIERNYAQKFHQLDMQMQRLKAEMQQKGTIFEIQNKKVQIENTKLERERTELKERIEQLEQQLAAMEKSHLSTEQLKQVLADVRIQNDRYADMEKSKNYYKEQWTKTTREVHKLKLTMLKQQQTCLKQKNSKEFDLCLEDILNEEQDALKSDRSELKSIKEMLFVSSDTSACELDD